MALINKMLCEKAGGDCKHTTTTAAAAVAALPIYSVHPLPIVLSCAYTHVYIYIYTANAFSSSLLTPDRNLIFFSLARHTTAVNGTR